MLSNEHPRLKGFFSYPAFPYIYVSKDGYLFNSETNKFLTISKTGKNYQYISIKEKRISIHRILAEMFLKKPKDIADEDLIVNHIDGCKGNNNLSNLEWTTYSGNSLHAYQNGLRNDNHVILLKEVGKDEIKRFYSLQETARFLGVNGYKVHTYLKNRFNRRPLLEKYLLTREGEEWPDESLVLTLRDITNSLPRDLVVVDTKEKKTFILEGYQNTADFIKIGINTLRHGVKKAHKTGKPFVINQFEIYYLEDFPTYVANDVTYIKNQRNSGWFTGDRPHPPKPILVTDLITKEQYRLDSSEELAKRLDVPKNTLQKHILYNNGVWKKQLKVEYV